jgi:hypothetical protein
MVDKKLGLAGTYKYAAKESRSLVFKSYVLVSSVVGMFSFFLIALTLITWLANPVGMALIRGDLYFREHVLLGVILLAIVIPLFTPVFVVSRRHRRGIDIIQNDRLMAGAGYGFLVSLFVGLSILDPNNHKLSWPLKQVGLWIDALPGFYGAILIILSLFLIVVIERKTRKFRPS